jgi:hypothetical protein
MRVDHASGSVDRWCDSAAGGPISTPNWAAFAPDGGMCCRIRGPRRARCARRMPAARAARRGGRRSDRYRAAGLPERPLPLPDGWVHWLERFTLRLRRISDSGPELVADPPGVLPNGVALDAEGGFLIGCCYLYRLLHDPPAEGWPARVPPTTQSAFMWSCGPTRPASVTP